MDRIINGGKQLSDSIHAWLIFSLCCIFYFYEYVLQLSPDVMSAHLLTAFSASEQQLGLLSAAFFLIYTLMQIPAGILLDRFGPHRLLSLACIACALGSILFATTTHVTIATIARLIMGLGAAFVFIGALKLIHNWFASSRFTLLVGLFVTMGMLGGIGSGAPLASLITVIGWRGSMLSLGLIGLIFTLLIFLVVKNTPNAAIFTHKTAKPIGKELIVLLKNKQLWLVSIYTGILSTPTIVLCGLYGIPFLIVKFHINTTTAASMISLILLGTAIGSPFWGWLSDHIKRRLPPMIIAAVVSPLLLLIIVYYPFSNLIMPLLLLLAFGFLSIGSLPSFSIAHEICKPEQAATALGFINTFDTLGGALALPLLGRLLGDFWSGTMKQHEHVYSLSDYKTSLTFMIALLSIAILLLPFIKETYAKQRQ